MAFTNEKLNLIFDRTDGCCHICRKKLNFQNYGMFGKQGDWEVEHSKPKSKGGTNHRNNLYAACISCNRSKNNSSTRSARIKHGYKGAPFSRNKRIENSVAGAGTLGTIAWFLAPPHLKVAAVLVSVAAGGLIGYNSEPE